jgi:hypothetical protein
MKRLAALTAGALIGLLFTAAPAHASHGNWNYKLNTDYTETRDAPKLRLVTVGRVSSTSQDACSVSLTNKGYATHGMRAQIIKRLTGTVIWDSGHVDVYPGEFFLRYLDISSESLAAEIYTKGWNDAGDVTYNDYTYDAGADDTVTYQPYGYWVNC